MAETSAVLKIIIQGNEEEINSAFDVMEQICFANDDYIDDDVSEGISVEMENVDATGVAERVGTFLAGLEAFGIHNDLKAIVNIDEDYGNHTILMIKRDENGSTIYETSYNVSEYGGNVQVTGSFADADELGQKKAEEMFESGKIQAQPFEPENEPDSEVIENIIDEINRNRKLIEEIKARQK